jgi:hypothetical protein
MVDYLAEVRRMEKFFDGFEVRYVSHLDNHDADHLAWIDFSRAPTLPYVIIEKLSKPSVRPVEEVINAAKLDLMVIDEPEQEPAYDWMSPIKTFLDNQPPLDDNAEVECIARKSKMYHLIDGVLYRRGTNGLMMRCIPNEEDIQLLQDIHSVVCGSHFSWRSIVGKAFRHDIYWPTTEDDAMDVVIKCNYCQFF